MDVSLRSVLIFLAVNRNRNEKLQIGKAVCQIFPSKGVQLNLYFFHASDICSGFFFINLDFSPILQTILYLSMNQLRI